MVTNKINLESFMIQAHQESELSFNACHAAIHIINDRRSRTLYQDIKNGEMPMDHFVKLLKMFGGK